MFKDLFKKQVKFGKTPEEIHDIDFYNTNGETRWDFEGFVPEINDQQLNWLTPKDGTSLISKNSKSLFLIYREVKGVIQAISECFEYEGLPEELDKYKIENKLIRDGQVAVFKRAGKFYVVNFSVVENDIYDEPTKIKVEEKESLLNGLILTNFVIFKSDSTGEGVYQALSMDLTSKIDTLTQLYYNLFDSRDKVLFPTDKPQGKMKPLLDSLRYSNKPYLAYQVGDVTVNADMAQALKDTMAFYGAAGVVKNLVEPIKLTDRGESLVQQYIFWENRIKEYIGLNINMLANATRAIQGEIAQQQGRNELILANRTHLREKAIEEVNKKFSVKWSVKPSEYINRMNESLKNNSDTGGEGND